MRIGYRNRLYTFSYSSIHKILLIGFVVFLNGCEAGISDERGGQDTATILEQAEVPPPETPQPKWYEFANDLTAEERIGQLLLIHLRWDEDGRPITSLHKEQKDLITMLQPGGIVLYAVNMISIEQTRALIAEIKELCIVPPFIAIDEEGGRVSRLRTSGLPASHLPSARTMAGVGVGSVEQGYAIIGKELAALGFNMNFAPVADIDFNPESDVVGDRSFGNNPELVAKMVSAAVKALQEENILAVVKHFPGHGRATGDSHTSRQSVIADWDTLLASDLIPFMAAFEQGAGGVMTAHVSFPDVDPSGMPVSLSTILLTGKLRNELSYDGLIITDALEMKGILKISGPVNAAVNSLKAGVDILLGPEDPVKLRDGIYSLSMEDSELTAAIDRAFLRVIAQKAKHIQVSDRMNSMTEEEIRNIVGSETHRTAIRTMNDNR